MLDIVRSYKSKLGEDIISMAKSSYKSLLVVVVVGVAIRYKSLLEENIVIIVC